MKSKDIKKQMEVYKNIGEENTSKIEEVTEVPEIPKKNFYFVVRQPFDNYKRGEHITDHAEIDRIEKQRLLSLVMKVNL